MSGIEEQLREIDAAAAEVFDLASRREAKEKAGSQRKAYGKAIRATREIAGRSASGELVEWIIEEIRTTQEFPTSRQVRKQGAEICRAMDREVPTDSWLGA